MLVDLEDASMITAIREKIDEHPEWPEMGKYLKKLSVEAIDHHGIVAAVLKATLVLPKDASEQIQNHPRHQDVGRALFLISPDLEKTAKLLLDSTGARRDSRQNMIFVNSLEVDDECRGRGYGTQMMRYLAKFQGITPVIALRASPFLRDLEEIPLKDHKQVHVNLRRFYSKLGFERAGSDVMSMGTKDLAFNIAVNRKQSPSNTYQSQMG